MKDVLLLIGGDYHPFEACGAICKAFVEAAGRYLVDVSVERNLLKKENISRYDAVITYTQGGHLTVDQEQGLLDYVRQGGAFAGLHSATASWKENAGYIDMLGGVFATHGPVHEFPVTIVASESELTRGIPDFSVTDELYILDRFDPARVTIHATAEWEGQSQPVVYAKRYGKGRVFYHALGHDERTFTNALFQEMVLRGLDWASADRRSAQ